MHGGLYTFCACAGKYAQPPHSERIHCAHPESVYTRTQISLRSYVFINYYANIMPQRNARARATICGHRAPRRVHYYVTHMLRRRNVLCGVCKRRRSAESVRRCSACIDCCCRLMLQVGDSKCIRVCDRRRSMWGHTSYVADRYFIMLHLCVWLNSQPPFV